tara:strand:- start:103 stop:693 length:591 start_codon:yes stop_codon:yes gene_type:complete
MIFFNKEKYIKGFTMVEVITAVLLSSIVVGALIYIVGEANFYLKKQMYRDNVNKYAVLVMDNVFRSAINANFVNIEGNNQIICGYRTTDSALDSLKIYQYRINQGVLVDGKPLENATFHNKDRNKNYYMQINDFRGEHTFEGQGYSADVRDAVIDIFLGITLHYTRGSRIISEEFPFKKTIFTRHASVYNASKELE